MTVTSEQIIQAMRNNYWEFFNTRIFNRLNKQSFVLENDILQEKPGSYIHYDVAISHLQQSVSRGFVEFGENPYSPSNNRIYITFKGLWFAKTYLAGQSLKP